jgi:hypothetical protein
VIIPTTELKMIWRLLTSAYVLLLLDVCLNLVDCVLSLYAGAFRSFVRFVISSCYEGKLDQVRSRLVSLHLLAYLGSSMSCNNL